MAKGVSRLSYSQDYYRRNRKKMLAARKAYVAANRDKVRDNSLKQAFGISLAEYERMFRVQNGVCAICRRPEMALSTVRKLKSLSVDHDHETGQIRALLCQKCNSTLGYMDDDPARLRAAADYIERYRG